MSVEIGYSAPKSEPNVVPLCDVLLVLLIIFMVVTPALQKGANVTLPEARYTMDQPEPGKVFEVFIKRDGGIIFNEKNVELSALTQKIQDLMEERQKYEKKILLKTDLEVEYGKVVDVMNALKAAGIETIGLVTQLKTSAVE